MPVAYFHCHRDWNIGVKLLHKIVFLHHICHCPFETSYTHVFEIVDLEKTDQV